MNDPQNPHTPALQARSAHARSRSAQLAAGCLGLWLAGMASAASLPAVVADAGGSAALLSTYASSAERLRHSPFQRPLFVDSTESKTRLKGEVHALMHQPLALLSSNLASPASWCELLLLHPNVALCSASALARESSLLLQLGRKLDASLESSYPIEFAFRVTQSSPNYFEVQLDAKKGPLGTSDYRILLAAVPAAGGKTFLHLAYSYSYGVSARLATQAYLATKGRSKVGFTLVGKQADGAPRYVGGLRGVIERNAMRYYLAIDAYLGAKATSGTARFEQSLGLWFDASEQFPRQLKDSARVDYLRVKRSEYQRQQASR